MGETADQLGLVLLAALLYGRRAARLRRRGRPAPAWRVACFAAGLAVLALAFATPVERLGETRLFSAHMLQHVLLGDVAPLLVVLGLTGPLLRPVLALPGVLGLRALVHPLAALPLWAADLVLWHVPLLYDAALAQPALHALQHGLFFACGALVWSALLEPLPGPRRFGRGPKVAYLGAMWFFSLALAQVFLWSRHPFYPRYAHAPRTWGLSALADQRLGGGVMLLEGSAVMLTVLVWLALRWWAEADAPRQEPIAPTL